MIKTKAITAKVPDFKKAEKELKRAADDIGAFMSAQFALTTRTWSKKNTPNWRPKTKYTNRALRVEVSTRKAIYNYVSGGTRVRWVGMKKPDDFVAKTKVGRIPAKKGAFFGTYFSPKPLPGIKAREFDKQIEPLARKRLKKIGRNLSANLRRFSR